MKKKLLCCGADGAVETPQRGMIGALAPSSGTIMTRGCVVVLIWGHKCKTSLNLSEIIPL